VSEMIKRQSPGGARWWTVAIINAAVTLASGGFAAAAAVKPGVLLPEGQEATPAATFYARYFAARSVPLAAMVVVLTLRKSTNRLSALLVLAGLVQAADALIGASYRNRAQTLAPALVAAFHLASARWLLRDRP